VTAELLGILNSEQLVFLLGITLGDLADH